MSNANHDFSLQSWELIGPIEVIIKGVPKVTTIKTKCAKYVPFLVNDNWDKI